MRDRLKRVFKKDKIIDFLIGDFMGSFIGFVVGSLTTSLFSHYVYEQKKLSNLFGLLPRKQILVDTTPGWVSKGLAILLGFMVMELIRYLYHEKKYLVIWRRIRMMTTKKNNQ